MRHVRAGVAGAGVKAWLVAGLLAGVAVSAPAAAQNGEGPVKVTVLAVERVGLGSLLPDAKDKRLVDALAMLPARVRELPHEFPDMPAEAASVINLVLATVSRPASLVLTYDSENPEGVAFGYGLVISFETAGKPDAEQLHAQIGGMLAAAGPEMPSGPSERWAGMTEFALPIGPLSFGPRESRRGWRYEVIVGAVTEPDAGLEAIPQAEAGVTPAIRGRFDFAGLTPVMSMAQGFAGAEPQAAMFIDGMREAGLWGPDAIKMDFVLGHTKEESVATTKFVAAKKYAEAWHASTQPLTAPELGAVPADAAWAGIGRGDLAWLQDILDHASEFNEEVTEGLEQFKAQTGVDLRDDVLAALGGTMAFYTSDSTGGGSLASAVAMITFKDRARFMGAHGKLAAFANAMAEQAPEPVGGGHIRITPWKDGDLELYSLRFPGLPVPLELTWAATDKWLVLGLTPQATVAAARQVTGKGDKGLTANAAFAAAMPKSVQPISVTFLDTTRMLKTGYPLISLLGSAIANGVRSPTAPEREPGMIVPVYHDLAKAARATVKVSYWRGEDLISETRGDRSLLVGAASMAGVMGEIAPLIAIPAAIGAAQGARNAAMELDEMGALDAEWPVLWRVALDPGTPAVARDALLMLAGAAGESQLLTEGTR